MRSRLTMSRDGSDLQGSTESPFVLIDRCFQVSPPGCHDTEGDACFGLPHGCPHGPVEIGAGPDDFTGECFGELLRTIPTIGMLNGVISWHGALSI